MHLLLLSYITTFATALGENCQTPTGQKGECVPLAKCQSLLWSFSNPKDGMFDYLKKFECVDNYDKGIFVCCRVATDILVFEDEEDNWDPNSIYNIKKLVNVNSCGIQQSVPQGNQILHLNEFPWLVKIVTTNLRIAEPENTFFKTVCTGVLINPRYVLYSAQCHTTFVEKDPNFYVQMDYYIGHKRICNSSSLSYTTNCSNFQSYEVEEYQLHPFYDPVTKLNDIALLRLSRRIVLSDVVRPICLPLVSETFNHNVLHTSGWNGTYFRDDYSVKTSNISTSITNTVCKRLNKGDDVLTTFDMCAVNGTTTDDDVAGYPVMSLYKNQWYIVGFTSRGQDPRIHTRVQNYLQWIKEAMGGERCLTPSNETGECIQVIECPRLMAAFANVDPKDEEYLNKFVCEYPNDDGEEVTDNYEKDQDTLKVCCGYNENFTILTNTTDTESDLYNISDNRICGLQHRDDYISFDETLSVDEFPWLAAIINGTSPFEHVAICGGSLITERYVLTSVQCTLSFNPEDIMLVRLGDYNLKSDLDCLPVPGFNDYDCTDVQEYKVEEKKDHPFYNGYEYIHDISLLRLQERVKFTDYVRPICLPTTEDDVTRLGETFYMTGFGDNEKDIEGPKIKKKIFTTLISLDVCDEKGKLHDYADPASDYVICTDLFENSTDVTCVGDEGGPVMFSKKFQWYIEGISSTYGCRNGEPLTHLKVFRYLKWIKSNLRD